ncbi:TPA: hypothetical protein KE579_001304 [Citrobacter braakii]|nr:hypothetical protein [Citrobacter braakii]
MNAFSDMSNHLSLNAYANAVVNSLDPVMYEDVKNMLMCDFKPFQQVRLGNPGITAPASFWFDYFGINYVDLDTDLSGAAFKEINL